MTKEDFIAGIGVLSCAGMKGSVPIFVANRELTPLGTIWYKLLQNLPAAVFNAAIEQVILEEEFFPTVSGIHKRALKMVEPLEITGEEIWGVVMKEISRVGGVYGSPEFDDNPLILEAVKVIGWRQICMTSDENVSIVRAQLRDTYNAIKKRHKSEASRKDLCNTSSLRVDRTSGRLMQAGEIFKLPEMK